MVFIFDPWWNKAAENQAIDRAHRIGQNKKVMSYKLITLGTIEEKILQLQEMKSKLFDDLIASEGAIKNKIILFKQAVQKDLPQNFELFFRKLLQNARTITDTNDYTILKLSDTDKELHRLIAHDDVLRALVIKAEKFHILVSNTKYPLFVKRMKALGYIIR